MGWLDGDEDTAPGSKIPGSVFYLEDATNRDSWDCSL